MHVLDSDAPDDLERELVERLRQLAQAHDAIPDELRIALYAVAPRAPERGALTGDDRIGRSVAAPARRRRWRSWRLFVNPRTRRAPGRVPNERRGAPRVDPGRIRAAALAYAPAGSRLW
jgi:hypothetical protein